MSLHDFIVPLTCTEKWVNLPVVGGVQTERSSGRISQLVVLRDSFSVRSKVTQGVRTRGSLSVLTGSCRPTGKTWRRCEGILVLLGYVDRWLNFLFMPASAC